ncbi:unnamed protein product [Orchesella dallaii]|uniref:Fibronectin type-III domain-containing protein n=1 Tax=Orchesella dallaii TaxID=48710 RepID=A0ABP1QVD9_9HEXA
MSLFQGIRLRQRESSSSSSTIITMFSCSSKAAVLWVFTLLIMNVLVGVSDSASVPISGALDDDDIMESLASSRILLDESSSTPKATTQLNKILPPPPAPLISQHHANGIGNGNSIDVDGSIADVTLPKESVNSYEMSSSSSSPLHVARCRATCLEKFKPQEKEEVEVVTPSSTAPSFSTVMDLTTTSADEMHLLPILRLRKKRATSKFTQEDQLKKVKKNSTLSQPWSCSNDSPDCLSCWQTCELLETGRAQSKLNPITSTQTESNHKDEVPCALLLDSKQCLDGCQVACSFYKHILLPNVEQQSAKAFTSNPVVATAQKNVVRIVPGKITWPLAQESNKNSPLSSPSVVYAVIQEYPDRKWRQIAQTTATEIQIPSELTSAMKTKLRSVRVLVVGPEGLLSVYSPEKRGEQLSDNNSNSQAVIESSGARANTLRIDVALERSEQEKKGESAMTTVTISDSSLDGNNNDYHQQSGNDNNNDAVTSLGIDRTAPDSPVTNSSFGGTAIAFPTVENDHSDGVEGEPFELRRVSLIHQKSLVIAELQWNGIGNNPSQEYLITWELTGGGLKGHLVTDSTSVTLSLWPDTLYQIQVELFEQNFDGDGEQPAVKSSPASLKSLPLIVDTSEASFPLESPSALLGNNDEEEEDEEDESEQEGNEWEEREEEDSDHKSITGFLNMTLVLGISVTALIFVLVILTLAAFTWTRTRSFSSSKVGCISGKEGRYCYKGCFSDCTEPELLLPQDELLDDSSTAPIHFFTVDLTKSKQETVCNNSILNGDICVAPSDIYTISSSSPREISHSTFSFWNEHSHLHTVSQLSRVDNEKCAIQPFHQ